MKKRFIATLLVLGVLLTGCTVMNTQKEIAAAVEAELPRAEEISSKDSHGGFQGDGLEVTVLQFESDVIGPQLEGSAGWHRLPLSQPMQILLYGVETDQESDGPYLSDDRGMPLLPQVEHGYYFFRDRHSESTDPYDDSAIYDRYSFNLTAAVFDTDTNRLYFVSFDT